MINLPKLIALSGVMGSGKTTVARYLAAEHGYTRTRFAGPFKAMLQALLLASGADASLVHDMVDGRLKEVPSDLLQGATPRHAMQTLGTEWGRDLIGPSLWTDAWRSGAEAVIAAGGRVVVDDCRFPNEAALVREMGGRVVRVWNMSLVLSADQHARHSSETAALRHDAAIMNDGADLEQLHGNAGRCLRWLAGDA